MIKRFDGKVAIVTGAGRGMGTATAKRLAAEGARVLAVDRDGDFATKVVEEILAAGGEAVAVDADVSDPARCEDIVKLAVDRFGALHYAVNNAGISGGACLTAETEIDRWQEVIAVNLSAVFYGMKYQIPAIIAAGGGAIVNVSSIFGSNGLRSHAPYTASKYGVIGLTRTAALDYAKQNIRINSMCPGMFDTPMGNSGGAHTDAIVAMVPNGRMGRPDEAANVTCFLLSDEASFVNASEYAVDAGMLH